MKNSDILFELAEQARLRGDYNEYERLKRAAFEASANED